MERIRANLQRGKPSIGVLMWGGPQLVPFIAQGGFDFVIPDMMFGRIDWTELSHMTDAAHAQGIACFPRLQAYPWTECEYPDRRLVVDTARAFSIGADGVCMSVASAEEVRLVVAAQGDWHRMRAVSSGQELKDFERKTRAQDLLFPLIEAKSAIDQIDAILDVPGLTGIFVAWTDFTRQLGLDFQYEHPEVLRLVSRIVQQARAKNLVVMANTGYTFQDPAAIAQRIKRMADLGVQLVMVQTLEFLTFLTVRDIARRLEDVLGSSG